MADAAPSLVKDAKTDLPKGRGNILSHELFRLLSVAEEGIKSIRNRSAIWADRLKTIDKIKKRLQRQPENLASIMANISTLPPSSPGQLTDSYGQLLCVVGLLQEVLGRCCSPKEPSGGPRVDWGLEALTRRTLEFWLMIGREVTLDHNRDGIPTDIVYFIQEAWQPRYKSSPTKEGSLLKYKGKENCGNIGWRPAVAVRQPGRPRATLLLYPFVETERLTIRFGMSHIRRAQYCLADRRGICY